MIESVYDLDKVDARKIKNTLFFLSQLKTSQLKTNFPTPTIWIDADFDIRLDWVGNALEPLISIYVDENRVASFLPVSNISKSISSLTRYWDINDGKYIPDEWIELIREATQWLK